MMMITMDRGWDPREPLSLISRSDTYHGDGHSIKIRAVVLVFFFGSTRARRHIKHFFCIFERVVDLIVLGFLSGTEEFPSAMI